MHASCSGVACAPATYPCRLFFKRNAGFRANGERVNDFQHDSSGQCGTITEKDNGSFVSRRRCSKRVTSRPMNAESNGGLA